jgi:hypothetical protein
MKPMGDQYLVKTNATRQIKTKIHKISFIVKDHNEDEAIHITYTVCFTNLDQGSEMTIFESILTTFIASIIFRSGWSCNTNWLELKIKQP